MHSLESSSMPCTPLDRGYTSLFWLRTRTQLLTQGCHSRASNSALQIPCSFVMLQLASQDPLCPESSVRQYLMSSMAYHILPFEPPRSSSLIGTCGKVYTRKLLIGQRCAMPVKRPRSSNTLGPHPRFLQCHTVVLTTSTLTLSVHSHHHKATLTLSL